LVPKFEQKINLLDWRFYGEYNQVKVDMRRNERGVDVAKLYTIFDCSVADVVRVLLDDNKYKQKYDIYNDRLEMLEVIADQMMIFYACAKNATRFYTPRDLLLVYHPNFTPEGVF
jgi:hypothetical protein